MKATYQDIYDQCKDKIPTEAYLTHLFVMVPDTIDIKSSEIDISVCEIHVGFYNPDTKVVLSFQKKGPIIDFVEDKAFQEKEQIVDPIDIDTAIDHNQAALAARKVIGEKYLDTMPMKTFMILQAIKPHGLVWNITILRRDFKTLNIKVNAQTSEIISDSCENLISFQK
jgi:hypothetical protein